MTRPHFTSQSNVKEEPNAAHGSRYRCFIWHRAAVANLLCERGFDVFGTTRSNNPVSQNFQMISLNVNSDSSVLECVGKVLSKNERVEVLVNNAGYALMGAAEETSIAEAKAQFETNFFGVPRIVNAVLPTMRKAGTGRIINIGSLARLTAIPFSPFYCATKFAIEAKDG